MATPDAIWRRCWKGLRYTLTLKLCSVGTSTIQDAKVTAGATDVVEMHRLRRNCKYTLADAIAEIHEYVKVAAQEICMFVADLLASHQTSVNGSSY